jgi:signal transduction histidine kinase
MKSVDAMKTPPALRGPGPGGAGLTPEALGELFHAFARASREIERSHGELADKVAELRSELAEKDRRLQEKKKLEALGLVVAGVAHEFRNPLGSVSLYLDCLAEAVRDLPPSQASEAANLISKIETAVRHLNAVVEDMLIFTRGAAGPDQPCDILRCLDEAILLLRGDLEAGAVECRLEVGPGVEPGEGGPVVHGDRDGVVRILMNVLKNAVQAVTGFRPRGQGKVVVAVRRAGPPAFQESVEVAVRDNGPGVPADRLERLFVPFYTEKQGGVGLGLYIVHSLIERQGGRVEVESGEGGGLVVRLVFAATSGSPPPAAGLRPAAPESIR